MLVVSSFMGQGKREKSWGGGYHLEAVAQILNTSTEQSMIYKHSVVH